MRATTLGLNGPAVGVLGLGCVGMSFGYDMDSQRDAAQSIRVIHRALDLGMSLLDTADSYGPYANEELIGRALAHGWRDRAVLATKVGLITDTVTATSPGSTTPGAGRNGSPDHIRRSIDGSLRRLQTDHVDLYQLHRIDPDVPLEDSWGAMIEIVNAGKARHIGLSEVTVEEIMRAQAMHPVTAVQSELSLWSRDGTNEVLPYCAQQGIAFLPFAPLGRGFLTGRFQQREDLPSNDLRRDLPRFQAHTMNANLAIIEGLRAVALRTGHTVGQIALAWVLTHGRYVIPIPGTRSEKHLTENAAASDIALSERDLADLAKLPAPVGDRY